MPMIIVEGPPIEAEQKRELTRRLTDVLNEVTRIRREAFVVIFHENPAENVGTGGELLADRLARKAEERGRTV